MQIDNQKTNPSAVERADLLNLLIRTHGYQSYLEIGVKAGHTFNKVKAPLKSAVDPDLRHLKPAYPFGGWQRLRHKVNCLLGRSQWTYASKGIRLFEMASDLYFSRYRHRFDVCLIDGLHTFDQVLRDYTNAQSRLNAGGCIILHDCNPQTEANAERIRSPQTRDWNGDTWKAVYHLRRQGQDIRVFDCDQGLGIAFKQSAPPLLSESEFQTLLQLPFEALASDRASAVGLLGWNETNLRRVLSRSAA